MATGPGSLPFVPPGTWRPIAPPTGRPPAVPAPRGPPPVVPPPARGTRGPTSYKGPP